MAECWALRGRPSDPGIRVPALSGGERILFPDREPDPGRGLPDLRKKTAEIHEDLRQGKLCHCCAGLASVVGLRGAPVCHLGQHPGVHRCIFETVSGFTTTGSTILQEIESLPMGINFWRCLTHWVGGMGVLVFVLMITSLDDENSMPLMRAEMPGPESDKLVPKARNTATILYGMYFALTAVEVILLMLGGMNLYDALVHSFSTAGTGGFNNLEQQCRVLRQRIYRRSDHGVHDPVRR